MYWKHFFLHLNSSSLYPEKQGHYFHGNSRSYAAENNLELRWLFTGLFFFWPSLLYYSKSQQRLSFDTEGAKMFFSSYLSILNILEMNISISVTVHNYICKWDLNSVLFLLLCNVLLCIFIVLCTNDIFIYLFISKWQ